MLGADFLTAECVRCDARASSRKDALQSLSQLLAAGPTGLTASEIYERLNDRERLGSTCLGNEVAIPHAHDAQLDRPSGALLLLREPVEFDAPDGAEVSVLLGVMLPPGAGEQELAALASALRLPDSLAMLQRARSPGDAAAIVMSRLQAGDDAEQGH